LDVECLRACSLVSSPLLVPSQRLIFRSLSLDYDDIPKAQSLFAVAPHILEYVHDVRVVLQHSLSAQHGVLAAILTSFPHLECLTISGGTIEWNDMAFPLRSAIRDLLVSTDLHSLNLAGILDVPSSFIVLALSSLRRLGLYGIIVEASDSPHPSRPMTLRTEQLILRAAYSDDLKPMVDLILHDSLTPGYLNIRRLTLGMNRDIQTQSLRLITGTARTLRHLQLRCGVFQTSLDLPRLPVLQVIELKIYLGYSAGLPANLYTAVATLPTAVPALEVLRFAFYGALPDREDLLKDRSGPFPLFDDACAYRERLPCLRWVHCHAWSDRDCSPQDCADFTGYIEGNFPGLWGTGILEISAGGDQDEWSFD